MWPDLAYSIDCHQPEKLDGVLVCGICTRTGVGNNGGPVPWREPYGCGSRETAIQLHAKATQQRSQADRWGTGRAQTRNSENGAAATPPKPRKPRAGGGGDGPDVGSVDRVVKESA